MRLKITHRTEYSYDQPPAYALQRLRLVPASGATQTVHSWALQIEGARQEVEFTDNFGNDTRLISVEGESSLISVEASGEVETINKAGVVGLHRSFTPLWLFRRETPLTIPTEEMKTLAGTIAKDRELRRLHELMAAIHDHIAPTAESPTEEQPSDAAPASQVQISDAAVAATPEEGLTPGGHAHAFIASARLLGFPARYVSGYLMVDGVAEQAASHAWAEAHVERLGWVGFDVVNCMCPDDSYVRVATGRDYRDAMPVSGIRLGQAAERLAVRISVEQ